MSNQPTIYYLTYEDVLDKNVLFNQIYPNLEHNYYWSDDWSCEFYILLAYSGFISVSFLAEDELVLLPEIQKEYALLDFNDLHISKKVQRLINEDQYELVVDTNIEVVIEQIDKAYEDNWITGKYKELLLQLLQYDDTNFSLQSVQLIKKESKELVAGEIGYIIGSTYTSLSGFSKKGSSYQNLGTLQMVLLAQLLQSNDFSFWNLGHPQMQYKLDLGAKIYSRIDFLKRWIASRDI